jgi:hypothetical protein
MMEVAMIALAVGCLMPSGCGSANGWSNADLPGAGAEQMRLVGWDGGVRSRFISGVALSCWRQLCLNLVYNVESGCLDTESFCVRACAAQAHAKIDEKPLRHRCNDVISVNLVRCLRTTQPLS